MKLEQLRIFLAVLEHGSFSRAADDLGISQSTVSFHMAALETVAESRLMHRGRGAVRATSQGVILRDYAQRMLALERDARARLQQAETTPSGRLALAVSTIVAAHLLPDLLLSYRHACPQVSVAVEVCDSRLALDSLRAEGCDLALIGAEPKNRRFHSACFAQDAVVLVGPPDGVRALESAAALSSLPLVLREHSSGTRAAVAGMLAQAQLDRPDIIVVGSTEAARRMVLAGLGYTLISRRAVLADLKARRLRIVSLPGTPVVRTFHLVGLRSQTRSPAAQALHELILASDEAQSARRSRSGKKATGGGR